MLRRIFCLAFLLTLGCSPFVSCQAAEPEIAESVSLIQLIATPERYEGRLIQVVGFIRLQFEGNAIYLHREDYESGLTENGLWLDTRSCKTRPRSSANFTKGYALVSARFTVTRRGHEDAYRGELYDVRRCEQMR